MWGWQLVSLGYYVTKATLSLLHGFSSLSTPFDAKKTWLIASMRHFRSFQFHILFLFFCHFCFQLFSKVKSRVRQRLPYLLDNSNYEHKNEFVCVLKRGLWSNRYRNLLQCKPIPVMKKRFILYSFSHREKPVFITWEPCNENRFFPVWKYYTGKTLFWPCTGPVRDCSVIMLIMKTENIL